MIQIQENRTLDQITTWHIPHQIRYYCNIEQVDQLMSLSAHPLFKNNGIKKYIIGKGANTLISNRDFDGLIIHIDIQGKECIRETEEHSYWKVMAGEDWCELVDFFVNKKSLGGIENLALIPGKVGAAPIQNIAAYGHVFEEVCEEVHCLNMDIGKIEIYSKENCHFGYRNSYFKEHILKGNTNLIVVAVIIKLNKKNEVVTNYESNYENLSHFLAKYGNAPYTPQQVFQAIVDIRTHKLPHIDDVGTNGSLFMNPITTGSKLLELLDIFPALQFYPSTKMNHAKMDRSMIQKDQFYKIAAGHIFEKIGWRYKDNQQEWQPKVMNQVGVWKGHSLVLVNYGTKDPQHIIQYIEAMQSSFQDATGISIVPEINII